MSIPYLCKFETKLMLQVVADLERHEGYREFAYPDPLSKIARKYKGKSWPWGFVSGRNLLEKITDMDERDGAPWTYGHGFAVGINPDMRINYTQSRRILEDHVIDMDFRLGKLLPWYQDASFVTKTILINMAFNMGERTLLKFRNTLAFIKAKEYDKAAHNMTLSLWYKQVGSRARELVKRMKTQTIEPAHRAPERIT